MCGGDRYVGYKCTTTNNNVFYVLDYRCTIYLFHISCIIFRDGYRNPVFNRSLG